MSRLDPLSDVRDLSVLDIWGIVDLSIEIKGLVYQRKDLLDV